MLLLFVVVKVWQRSYGLLFFLGVLMGFGGTPSQGGEMIELPAVADTTLIEYAPDHNMGHHSFMNAGSTFNVNAPGTSMPSRNRALMLFDLTQVPNGSRITSAEVHVEVTGEPLPGNGAPSLFALHRVLRPWGEGTKVSSLASPGLGALATIGEATWQTPFALTGTNWSSPGGAANIDFVAAVTGTQFIEDASGYVFASEAEVIADVQLWLDHPEQNFGWMLRTLSETMRGTARRFGTREDGNNVARLVLEFIPPPTIDSVLAVANELEIRFTAQAGATYTVEYTSALPAVEWATLETVESMLADTPVVIRDGITNSLRFYRVILNP